MPTTRETVLAALHARLQPLTALALRHEVLPERIPATRLIIRREGQAGEPITVVLHNPPLASWHDADAIWLQLPR